MTTVALGFSDVEDTLVGSVLLSTPLTFVSKDEALISLTHYFVRLFFGEDYEIKNKPREQCCNYKVQTPFCPYCGSRVYKDKPTTEQFAQWLVDFPSLTFDGVPYLEDAEWDFVWKDGTVIDYAFQQSSEYLIFQQAALFRKI